MSNLALKRKKNLNNVYYELTDCANKPNKPGILIGSSNASIQ